MTKLAQRDDGELARGFTRWCAREWPDATHEITSFARPKAGWSNETLLVTLASRTGGVERRERLVVRLPPPLPTWPSYDLTAQARVLEALSAQPVPVPRVVALELDEQWLGAAFLVMALEPGRPGPEAPALAQST